MEIILIRHTTPDIAKGICYGQSDINIRDSFLEEIKPILKEIPVNNENVTFYSSPLKRCAILAKELTTKITFDNRLKELNFGDWELKKWDEINRVDLDIWMNDFVNVPTKNGESYIDLHQRTTSFLKELKQNKTKKAIIVTHAGVIRSIWSYINNIPLEKSFDLKLAYGAIIKLNLV
ncbi:alpha-ribazole phosphatase [Tenacibaculum sp. E3R01]|uniref:alpha-ribazole phosphatase n=1 Tax=Tenacibaculum sp. E3R01 TaxID=2267227 RepID=UPI000DE8D275|nr:alpha-ribazole phosphatase [Tenacibaculum sp. E3R01]RBW63124.1 alpha-ribazole phosphatase [Tenacibaculum sp. E3R01]